MPAPDRKRLLTAYAVAMAVLIATPLTVVAADAFNDVPDSNVHHDDITWLRDNGVTLGCNPPDNTEFCPGDPVLRQQMASFMRRLAENQVVDAATAQEANHAATADSSTDAEMLNGQPADHYLDTTVRTVLKYNGTQSSAAVGDFEKLRDIGGFEKLGNETALRLRLTSHGTKGAVGTSCTFQLRIDDALAGDSGEFAGFETIINAEARTPLTNEAYFEDIPAGNHTVSLWVRGAGSPDCTENPGDFTRVLVVEELPASSSLTTVSPASGSSATSDSEAPEE